MYTALIVLKNSNNLMYNKNQLDTRVGLPPWKFDHSPQIFALLTTGKFPKKTTFHGTDNHYRPCCSYRQDKTKNI